MKAAWRDVFLNPMLLVHVSELIGLRESAALDSVCSAIQEVRAQFCKYAISWDETQCLKWLVERRIRDPVKQLILKVTRDRKAADLCQEAIHFLCNVAEVRLFEVLRFRVLSRLSNITGLTFINDRGSDSALIKAAMSSFIRCNSPHLRSLTLAAIDALDNSLLTPLTRLRNLEMTSVGIESIECVATMHDLEVLVLQQTRISDLSPLKRISSLAKLDVSSSPVSDLLPVAHHTRMRYLAFSSCPVADLSFLDQLEDLEQLRCVEINAGADFSHVARLSNLRVLVLSCNRLGPLHFLTGLKSLCHLILPSTATTDIDPLRQLTSIQHLRLHGNPDLVNVDALRSLTQLRTVTLSKCGVVAAPEDFLPSPNFKFTPRPRERLAGVIRIFPN